MKIVKFSSPPTLLVHLRPTFYQLLDLRRPNLNEPTPLSNKLWNDSRTAHVKEQNQNQNKTKSCHIQIDHGFYCPI